MGIRNRSVRSAALFAALACGALVLTAQRPFRGGGRGDPNSGVAGPTDFALFNAAYDGRFTYTRLRYTPYETGYGGGGGFFGGINYWWDHDYNRADHQFPRILDEITGLDARYDSSNIFAATDPELFRFPFAYLSEPGHWNVSDSEAVSLRAFLLKGGFVLADDFVGTGAWNNLLRQMLKVVPDLRPIRLTAAHPVFHSFFDIDTLNFRHPYQGVPAEFWGWFEDNDPTRRMMLIANYNNDISESWEYSGTGFIPIELSNEAFKLGVNYVVYAMTH